MVLPPNLTTLFHWYTTEIKLVIPPNFNADFHLYTTDKPLEKPQILPLFSTGIPPIYINIFAKTIFHCYTTERKLVILPNFTADFHWYTTFMYTTDIPLENPQILPLISTGIPPIYINIFAKTIFHWYTTEIKLVILPNLPLISTGIPLVCIPLIYNWKTHKFYH